MAKFDISQVPHITWLTINNLLKDGDSDCAIMYMRYLYKAQLDKTNRPWANTEFMMKGLGWGRDKVQRTRSKLEKLGYVTVIKKHDSKGYLSKYYIQLNKLVGLEKMQSLEPDFQLLGKASLEPENPTVVKISNNCLKDNNLNILKDNNLVTSLPTKEEHTTVAKGEPRPAAATVGKSWEMSSQAEQLLSTITKSPYRLTLADAADLFATIERYPVKKIFTVDDQIERLMASRNNLPFKSKSHFLSSLKKGFREYSGKSFDHSLRVSFH